jgi:hypothetical protein
VSVEKTRRSVYIKNEAVYKKNIAFCLELGSGHRCPGGVEVDGGAGGEAGLAEGGATDL